MSDNLSAAEDCKRHMKHLILNKKVMTVAVLCSQDA